eukprot:Nk52_evm2s725 gene=Nk52_evmTU2s725
MYLPFKVCGTVQRSLIDSGASALCMNSTYVDTRKFKRIPLVNPQPIYLADDQPPIYAHECVPNVLVEMPQFNIRQRLTFYVLPLNPHQDTIFGCSWLDANNVKLQFGSRRSITCNGFTVPADSEPLTDSDLPIPTISALQFRRAAKKKSQ